jgi:hypothetical protein
MAPVLKTGVPKGTVGSNPTPSVLTESEGIRLEPATGPLKARTVFENAFGRTVSNFSITVP